MKILTISSFAIIVGLMLVGSATAGEQKLKFRVVMTEVGGSTTDVAGLKGHAMGAAKYAGFCCLRGWTHCIQESRFNNG